MRRMCTVTGCHADADGYSTKCGNHKTRERRHGDPAQTPITAQELQPFVRRVVLRMKNNPGSPAWAVLDARWGRLVDAARAALEAYHGGQPAMRQEVAAAAELVKLDETVGSRRVAAVALAMHALRWEQPHRFASDKGFAFQLARRVRGQSAVNRGSTWDNTRKKVRTVYREMPPRATATLAEWLRGAYGDAASMLVVKDEEDAKAREAAALEAAIRAMR
jgi:hypothetical protein